MKTTGTIIKELREKTGLTMDEMADRLKSYGVNPSKSMISRWENDKAEPSMEYARILARFFDISLDYLLGLDTDTELQKAEDKINKYTEQDKLFFSKYENLNDTAKKQLLKIIETFEDETQD
ncbi:helix-turn-helix domain-containing protein [Clostridium sp. MSJ-8]|uniref:helix-turn-helix domain-containing protein n=1 Tax=Clostridium sp. MSJ-8 TaxID=2841510 RepID=UPI001C0EAFA7|nr:helix-turn-helix transcriptional regulator [Clostridium sp. MSJ-8]MBU5486984.1 helix-turn-helix domain-containing protein [Clostridium sp. MSJ-8]